MKSVPVVLGVALIAVIIGSVAAQQDEGEYGQARAPMRNALVRFGRAGMRNALVRFGKRADPSSALDELDGYEWEKRNGAPQPFVRFGRAYGRVDHMHDLINTLHKLQADG